MQVTESINLPYPISLWPEGSVPLNSPADADLPTLTYYLPESEYRTGQSILLMPGGGYGMVSSAKEGHRPAQLLATHGVAVGVLEYRHNPHLHPVPLIDAQRAVRAMRAEAQQHTDLDPYKVGCMGFSAGGHLAGSLLTQENQSQGMVGDDLDTLLSRPDFGILVYPVISFTAEWAHFGSRDNLLGNSPDQNLTSQLSLENAVTAETPECLLIHGQGDTSVPVANSVAFFQQLTQHGIKATMHVYDDLPHGIGFGANHPWRMDLLRWLARR